MKILLHFNAKDGIFKSVIENRSFNVQSNDIRIMPENYAISKNLNMKGTEFPPQHP